LRAAASPTTFAIVAPVVSTPPYPSGSSKSWRSQSIAARSRAPASGEPTQAKPDWS
jgi:hypothetical protein